MGGVLTLPVVEARLREAIARGLPGYEAQCTMAPRPRPHATPGELPSTARTAAALLLLYPRDATPHVVLTVRAGGLRHAGQVSLPGGALDATETVESAALREAEEEIGLDRAAVRVLGPLTPLHVAVSGFELHPVAGVCDEPPRLVPSEAEVRRILEVPLATLTEPDTIGHMPIERFRVPLTAPYFHIAGERVWGATAMILAELLWILGMPADPARAGDVAPR